MSHASTINPEIPLGISAEASEEKSRTIKLIIWDLDNTLWQGTLLEGDSIQLCNKVRETLATLDQRGILHSIASKNDQDAAIGKLKEFGLEDYFLYPQMNWSSKVANIQAIGKSLNIGMDTVAFIDDDPFEREEVRHALPDLLILDAKELEGLSERPEFIPPFITEDSARRRQMYRADMERKKAEDEFIGPSEVFLASLKMKLVIAKAREEDLQRAEELTLRTNQLNTTGYTYSYQQLNEFRQSPRHLLLVASLDDRFGDYGKIGLVLIDKTPDMWTIKLLLMSCRVMSRGVGTLLINHVLMLARENGIRLRSEFRATGRNRMMVITYKFGGFKEVEQQGPLSIFEHDLQNIPAHPDWVQIVAPVAQAS
ncbi:MAG TPA: HAD-IIIC family phosphatase [Candidatus Angelobacter sp.]|jgi:FkbH-like protein